MFDLYLGIAISLTLSVALCFAALRVGRHLSRLTATVVILLLTASLFWYATRFADDLRAARLLPFSNVLILGNFTPPAVGLIVGLAWRLVPGRILRKGFVPLVVTDSTLSFTNGTSLTDAGSVSLAGSDPNADTLLLLDSPTLNGTGQVTFDTPDPFRADIRTSATASGLTIAPGITVRTGTGSGTVGQNSYPLLNQGTLSSPTAGKTLVLAATTITNAGTLEATNGGLLAIAAPLSNTGTLRVANGSALTLAGSFTNSGSVQLLDGGALTLNGPWSNAAGVIDHDATSSLNLGGAFTTADLGTITGPTYDVTITGTLDNTSSTLLIQPSSGPGILTGRIKGGTLSIAPGASFEPRGTLDAVTLASDLTASHNLQILNGLTLAGGSALSLDASSDDLTLATPGSQTIGGAGQILFDGTTTSTALLGDHPDTLTLGPGVTLRNGTGNGSVPATLVNQGTISADVTGRSITFSNLVNQSAVHVAGGTLTAYALTNSGTLDVSAGTLEINATPHNTGSINLTGGLTYLTGTDVPSSSLTGIHHSAGILYLAGSFDNAGRTWDLDSIGPVAVTGTIAGGTLTGSPDALTADDASLPAISGTLDDVTLASDFHLTRGFSLRNSLTLANSTLTLDSVLLSNANSLTLAGTGTLSFAGNGAGLDPADGTVLTIAPDITLRTADGDGTVGDPAPSATGATDNYGTLSAQTPGHTLTATGATFHNFGAMQATNGGTLAIASTSFTNSGTITVDPSSTLLLTNAAASSPNGTINLSGHAILNYTGPSPADTLRQQLALGRDGITGLILPEAASDSRLALAYAEASLLLNLSGSQTAIWSGQRVDSTSLLLLPTLAGDANLDGLVNADDYALLDRSYAASLTNAHWTDGDFNYDGAITSADYLLIDTTYAQSHPLTPAFLSQRESQFGPAYVTQLLTSVPEPSTPLLLLSTLPLLSRRRRRRP